MYAGGVQYDPQMKNKGSVLFGLGFLLLAGCAGMERMPPQTDTAPVESVPVKPPTVVSPVQSVPKTPAKAPAASVPPAQPRMQQASPPLDMAMLETRLKETKAIGVFTKITLKNQVDDLLNQFRAHYQGNAKTSLADLRQPYDRLLLKVLSLLQDGDAELARTIMASREAIWNVLADPAKFATL